MRGWIGEKQKIQSGDLRRGAFRHRRLAHLDGDNQLLCLDLDDGTEVYEIDFRTCKTSAEVLDWIMEESLEDMRLRRTDADGHVRRVRKRVGRKVTIGLRAQDHDDGPGLETAYGFGVDEPESG